MFDAVRFGQILRELRGRQSQTDIERLSGVPQHTISSLELGNTQRPSFPDIVALGEVYGLSPSDMARLAGLWSTEDDDNTEPYHPELAIALYDIRSIARDLNRDEQRFLAGLLKGVALSVRSRMESVDRLVTGESVIPEWARRKLAG